MRLLIAAGVGVNRQEQVGPLAIGDRRPLLQRNEHVGVAGHDHLHTGLLLQQRLQPQRDVQRQLGFVDAVALRARIVPAVAGVDDDARHTQAELSRQGELAVGVGGRRQRIGNRGRLGGQRRGADGTLEFGGRRRRGRGYHCLRWKRLRIARCGGRRGLGLGVAGGASRRQPRHGRGHRAGGAPEVDDQPVGSVEGINRVARHAFEIDDETRRVLRVAAEAHFPDHVVVELERDVLQRRRRLDALEIEEQSPRIGDLLLMVGDLAVEIDGQPDAVGQRGPVDFLEQRNRSRRAASVARPDSGGYGVIRGVLGRRAIGG